MRPDVLDKLGLITAIKWQVEEFRERAGIPCDLSVQETGAPVEAEVSIVVFRILQEALTNIARHSKATRAGVSFRQDVAGLRLEVKDDGKGIDAELRRHPSSLGLKGMQERAMLVRGRLTISAVEPSGTCLTLHIPSQGL